MMNETKHEGSEFIRLKTFLCVILSGLERVGKAEIDAHAFSHTLVAIARSLHSESRKSENLSF